MEALFDAHIETFDECRSPLTRVSLNRKIAEEHDIKEIRAEIKRHIQAKAQIELEVPRTVSLGMVIVNCEVSQPLSP